MNQEFKFSESFCETKESLEKSQEKSHNVASDIDELSSLIRAGTYVQTDPLINDNNQNDLICPISLKKIKVPVVTSDGYVFEKAEIARWLEKIQEVQSQIYLSVMYCIHCSYLIISKIN